MTTNTIAEGNASATTEEPNPTDRAVPCVDLALDYACDELLIDFGAWSAARQATTDTLRRQVEVV